MFYCTFLFIANAGTTLKGQISSTIIITFYSRLNRSENAGIEGEGGSIFHFPFVLPFFVSQEISP